MTEIKSALSSRTARIQRGDHKDHVWIANEAQYITVDREEFAQAVRDLGFDVIDKAELPEVKFFADGAAYAETDRGFGDYTLEPKDTPERLIDHARALLALAAYLEANPPVDPKVEALADLIWGVYVHDKDEARSIAKEMFATGRIDIKEAS